MHRHDHAQRGVDVLELLAGQAQRDVVHPGAAVLRPAREMPSSPSDAICGRIAGSKRCARSSSRMRGATSRPAHSRTDCSSSDDPRSARSSASRKTRHPSTSPCRLCARDGDAGAATERQALGGAAAVHRHLEMIGAAEQRADGARLRLGVGRDDRVDRLACRRRSRSGRRRQTARTSGDRRS